MSPSATPHTVSQQTSYIELFHPEQSHVILWTLLVFHVIFYQIHKLNQDHQLIQLRRKQTHKQLNAAFEGIMPFDSDE